MDMACLCQPVGFRCVSWQIPCNCTRHKQHGVKACCAVDVHTQGGLSLNMCLASGGSLGIMGST